MSNCLFEATLQIIEQVCNCTPKNFLVVAEGYSSCTAVKKKCMNGYLDAIGNVRSIDDNGVVKDCYAACIDQKHSFLISEASYPNFHTYDQQPEFCVVVEKLQRSCSGSRLVLLENHYPNLCQTVHRYSSNDSNPDCLALQQLNKETGNSSGIWKDLKNAGRIYDSI